MFLIFKNEWQFGRTNFEDNFEGLGAPTHAEVNFNFTFYFGLLAPIMRSEISGPPVLPYLLPWEASGPKVNSKGHFPLVRNQKKKKIPPLHTSPKMNNRSEKKKKLKGGGFME